MIDQAGKGALAFDERLRLQKMLQQSGLYQGDIDADLGAQSKAAMASFKEANPTPALSAEAAQQAMKVETARLLSRNNLSSDDKRDLQHLLKAQGYGSSPIDGVLGKNSQSGMAAFIAQNPDSLGAVHTDHLQAMIRAGQGSQLKAAFDQSPAAQARLKETLESAGNLERLPPGGDKIVTTQTLLAAAGFYGTETAKAAEEIGGYIGGKTLQAVAQAEQRLYATPSSQVAPDTPSETAPRDAAVDIFATASISDLQAMLKNGEGDTLKAAYADSPAGKARLTEALQEAGDLTRLSARSEQAYAVQTLLAASGHFDVPTALLGREIDGIVGPNTLRAAAAFGGITAPAAETDKEGLSETFNSAAPAVPPPELKAAPDGRELTSVPADAIAAAWDKTFGRKSEAAADGSLQQVSYQQPKTLIVLDPGHNETRHGAPKPNPGTYSKAHDVTEVQLVDAVSLRTAEILEQQGYAVAFTRVPGETFDHTRDFSRSLSSRPQYAQNLGQEIGADNVIFISMHADGVESGSPRGGAIYVQGRNGNPQREASQDLARAMASNYEISGVPTEVKTASFSVLRDFEKRVSPQDPAQKGYAAVLVELGYLTTPGEAALLKGMMNNPDAAARMLAQGIMTYDRQRNPQFLIAAAEADQLEGQPKTEATMAQNSFAPPLTASISREMAGGIISAVQLKDSFTTAHNHTPEPNAPAIEDSPSPLRQREQNQVLSR